MLLPHPLTAKSITPELSKSDCAHISLEAKDLIRKMLEKDPRRRIKAAEVLKHSWLSCAMVSKSAITDTRIMQAAKNLREFGKRTAFNRAALSILAQSMTTDEIKELKDIFIDADTDNDGSLNIVEFRKILSSRDLGLPQVDVDQLFAIIDRDQTGSIEYTEFITACLTYERGLQNDKWRRVFDSLDVSKTGYLSVADLFERCAGSISRLELKNILSTVDKSNDGLISLDEFINAMKESPTSPKKTAALKSKTYDGIACMRDVVVPQLDITATRQLLMAGAIDKEDARRMEAAWARHVNVATWVNSQKASSIWTVYEKSAQLGTGMNGDVYLVTHKQTGVRYAAKSVKKKHAKSASLIRDIRNEISIFKEMDHPNIVKLYEVFEDTDAVWIVLELCSGGELYDGLLNQDHGHFTERGAANLFYQMLSSICFLHDKGIAHRDLKLENFLFQSKSVDSPLKLIDFGLSQKMNPDAGALKIVGTSYYIAPEVLTCQSSKTPYSHMCDMWSLGVLLYMLLSGTPPFDGKTDREIMRSILRCRLSFPSSSWNGISMGARDLISKLMERDPKRRITAKDALKHPWMALRDEVVASPRSLAIVASNLADFGKMTLIKKTCANLVAFSLSAEEIKDLRNVFTAADKNGDGALSIDEFKTAMEGQICSKDIRQIFSAVDVDKSGSIQYSEFLAASMRQEMLTKKENMMMAFKRLDQDGNGYLEASDFEKICNGEIPRADIDAMIQEAMCGTGAQRISFHSFEQFIEGRTPPPKPPLTTHDAQSLLNEGAITPKEYQDMLQRWNANIYWTRAITGRNIWTDYDKSKILGNGMNGKVYEIIHKVTGAKYAGKSVEKKRILESELGHLRNEIALLQDIDSPYIIKLFETYEDQESIWLVLELCTGGEMYDSLVNSDTGIYTEMEASSKFSEMLTAVAHLHELGIAHRDLKLENFMLESKRTDAPLKLIDFGLSKRVRDGPARGQVGTSYYIAPEVLTSKLSTESCDMWGLGVLLYMMLSGRPPFDGHSDKEIMKAVVKGTYTFPKPDWNCISTEAIDLVKKLLTRNPSERITALEALRHPWLQIRSRIRASKSSLIRCASNLSTFGRMSALKKTCAALIAYSLTPEEVKEMRQIFIEMDKNGDGSLNIDEFREAMKGKGFLEDGQVDAVFNHIDADKSGTIQYSEFIAAALPQAQTAQETKLRYAFERLDADQSGYIDAKDLRSICCGTIDAKLLEHIINEVDLQKDGRIEWEEFVHIMRSEISQSATELKSNSLGVLEIKELLNQGAVTTKEAAHMTTTFLKDVSWTETNSGQNIWSSYTKSRLLGQGMNGAVYEISHKITGDRFAGKSVSKISMNNRALRDLRNEISLLKGLDHPHIVKLYEVFEDAKSIWLVLELCSGGELFDSLADCESGAYTEREAATKFHQMLSAVAYLHEHGVVHRDLKLENYILVDKKPKAPLKLIDFGLSAKLSDALGITGIVGTSYYIAPEVLDRNIKCGLECDIWSLGVLLFMMLTGMPPFNGNSDKDIITAVKKFGRTGNPKVLLQRPECQRLSENAKNMLERMFQVNTKVRITAAEALRHPWFDLRDQEDADLSVYNDVASSLKTFGQLSSLKKTCASLVAFSMTSEKIDELRKIFMASDKDGNGSLSLIEFRSSMSGFVDADQIDEIFSSVDVDGSGEIAYREFLAAAISQDQLKVEAKLRFAFKGLDKDGSGYLDINDLEKICNGSMTKVQMRAMILEVDPNSDGKIEFEEFIEIMKRTGDRIYHSGKKL